MTNSAAALLARSNMTEASSASPSPERPLIEAGLLHVVMAEKPQNNACREKDCIRSRKTAIPEACKNERRN